MQNNNSNNNNSTRKEMLVDTHFDNMDNLARAREDYVRKSDKVVEKYNDMPLNRMDRLEMENLIERKRSQDQILADGVVQANSVYDLSRNPNADSIDDEINMRVERRILDQMRGHNHMIKGLIEEMEEITGNNLTRNPDSSQSLKEAHDKLEQSSLRYEGWITRSDMTLDQYYFVDHPHRVREDTTQPDQPLPEPEPFSDSESDSGSDSELESNISEELSESIAETRSESNLSEGSWETISDSDGEEVTEGVTEEVEQGVTQEASGETTEETTDKNVEDTVKGSAKDTTGNTYNTSAVDTSISSSSKEGPASKRKREESEELEEESYINPTKRLKDTEQTDPEEEKKVEAGPASENVVSSSNVEQEPASASTDLASSSRKRKRDDEEDTLGGDPDTAPKEKKEKLSLLDDFADVSTEPADYFGGDD